MSGVRTMRGDISAQAVVWAAGAWGNTLESEGVSLPLEAVRVGLLMTQPVHPQGQAILHGPIDAGSCGALSDLPSFKPEEFPSSTALRLDGLGYQDMIAQAGDGSLQFGHVYRGQRLAQPAHDHAFDEDDARHPSFSAAGLRKSRCHGAVVRTRPGDARRPPSSTRWKVSTAFTSSPVTRWQLRRPDHRRVRRPVAGGRGTSMPMELFSATRDGLTGPAGSQTRLSW